MDCTVLDVISSGFQWTITRLLKNVYVSWYAGIAQVSLAPPRFGVLCKSEHLRVIHTDLAEQDLVHIYQVMLQPSVLQSSKA